MRMTGSTLAVLDALVSDPSRELYGLEIAQRAGVASGTLYPILLRLERERWVVGTWESIDESEEGRRRRRYYKLTGHGVVEARRALSGRQRAHWTFKGATA
jgi:PadR family transcriptional regulator PadR